VAVGNGAAVGGAAATDGAEVTVEGVAVGTVTVGNDSLPIGGAAGVALEVGVLISAVPTPYVYTIFPPRDPI